MNSLFITNKNDLYSIPKGGVQICSEEYLDIVKNISSSFEVFYIKVSRKWSNRLLRKLNIDSYKLYDVSFYLKSLIDLINEKKIEVVFLNKAELICFSKPIKEIFQNKVKVVVLSHGTETGDYLHEIVLNQINSSFIHKTIAKYRLGINLYKESYYRHNWIDLVCTLSNEDENIEKWLGSKNTLYIPRIFNPDFLDWKPESKDIGFVGTLNHTPNKIALEQIFCLLKVKNIDLKFHLVGGGEKIGKEFEERFEFVQYHGKLSDDELKVLLSKCKLVLNPIFWYSKGASMKLGQLINWGLPVLSTKAGSRGYLIENDCLVLSLDNPTSFVSNIEICLDEFEKVKEIRANLIVKHSQLFSLKDASTLLKNKISNIIV